MKGIRNYELKSREITLEALLKEIGLKIHHNFIPNFLWLELLNFQINGSSGIGS